MAILACIGTPYDRCLHTMLRDSCTDGSCGISEVVPITGRAIEFIDK